MAIDFGTKRIGIAVTDPMKIIASPLETVSTGGIMTFLDNYLKKEEVEEFVVGYPRQMNNTPSEAIRHINPFIKKLKNRYPGIKINLADERFTSKMAFQALIAGGVKKKDRQDKALIDKISASLILQSFLEAGINKKDKEFK